MNSLLYFDTPTYAHVTSSRSLFHLLYNSQLFFYVRLGFLCFLKPASRTILLDLNFYVLEYFFTTICCIVKKKMYFCKKHIDMKQYFHKMTTCLGLVAMACLAALLTGCNNTTDMEQQVDELYSRMSQQERISQLKSMYMDDLFGEDGQLDTAKCRELIPNGIGHFSQFCMQQPRDPNDLRDRVAAVQQWLMDHTPNGIPALMHEEVRSCSTPSPL